jgi:hypothetical protein
MTPHALLGRRVKVLAWDDLRDVLPKDQSGTITHVTDFGDGGVEVTVRPWPALTVGGDLPVGALPEYGRHSADDGA